MSELAENNTSENDLRSAVQTNLFGRLSRLCLKELREILRDRRTMITLILMPLIVYPLLALLFQRILLGSYGSESTIEYVLGFENEQIASHFVDLLAQGDRALRAANQLERPSKEAANNTSPLRWDKITNKDAGEKVANGSIDIAILANTSPKKSAQQNPRQPVAATLICKLLYRQGSPTSQAALEYVEERLQALNELELRRQLQAANVGVSLPAKIEPHEIQPDKSTTFPLAAVMPLILVLMTVTGAVYPAIDLTAGERERGTLETLIASPVPRIGLLLAKYVAVLTVAILTAMVNLVGMAITVRSTGLDAILFAEASLSLSVVLKVLALLILLAAFFSAVLLALTSYTRTFKEAQAYIIPLMLLCLMPGILCLLPGIEFTGLLAVVPLVNIVLLARNLLEGSVNPTLAAATVVSTAFYILGAIAIAARIFGTDAVLYGGGASWSSFHRSSKQPRAVIHPTIALTSLAALFPCYFVLSNLVTRGTERTFDVKAILGALVTILLFGGIPLVLASLGRYPFNSSLALRKPKMLAVAAAGLLGLTLWPLAYEIVIAQQALGIRAMGIDQLASIKQLINEIPEISPWVLLFTLAIVPGICEELFFRGFLLCSLRSAISPWKAILITSLLFGLFHVITANVLAEWRFLPSTFLGLVLGWLCYRTSSVIPGMFLHVLHNGLLLMLAHFRPQLTDWGFGSEAQTHLPAFWLLASLVGGAAGIFILKTWSRPQPVPA
jgi:sodium transport system permease protein